MDHKFKKNDSVIIVIGKTFGHIEQSVYLEEIYSIVDGQPPEINLINEKNNGESILNLIDKGYVKSAHDISLGGILIAISKMCIKGNKGIQIKKPKFLINEIEYFFAEDQGRYLIEIKKKDLISLKSIKKIK